MLQHVVNMCGGMDPFQLFLSLYVATVQERMTFHT